MMISPKQHVFLKLVLSHNYLITHNEFNNLVNQQKINNNFDNWLIKDI